MQDKDGDDIHKVPPGMLSTVCPICLSSDHDRQLYAERLGDGAFTSRVFSARRDFDGLHYRMVRCQRCGLVRSNPIAAPGSLHKLYEQSELTYGDELENIKKTYEKYLLRLDSLVSCKESLLEIGCGSGFFLEAAVRHGYERVEGVEPSADAVKKADSSVGDRITLGVFEQGMFPEDSFDVICMFQVLDHVANPGEVLAECSRILRREGLLLILNHNVDAISSRILKEKSPIVDIEHTFLYSPRTLKRLMGKHGLNPLRSGTVWNHYSIAYLMKLLPFPRSFKTFLVKMIKAMRLSKLSVLLPLGNMYVVARKANGGQTLKSGTEPAKVSG